MHGSDGQQEWHIVGGQVEGGRDGAQRTELGGQQEGGQRFRLQIHLLQFGLQKRHALKRWNTSRPHSVHRFEHRRNQLRHTDRSAGPTAARQHIGLR